MTITTYTDREIALQKQVAELEKELSDTDIALEECKMDWSGDVTQIKAEHKHEVETLRQQLAEAQALIEASRKQEPAGVLRSDEFDGHVFEPTSGWPFGKLYAAPVVADDVLEDAQRYRWLRSKTLLKTLPLVRVQIMNQGSYALQQGKELDALIDKAMGGSA